MQQGDITFETRDEVLDFGIVQEKLHNIAREGEGRGGRETEIQNE